MSFNILAESENYLSWDAAFRLLSLERCLPFFKLMGLSSSLSEHPTEIVLLSRKFLQQGYVHKADDKIYLDCWREDFVEAFTKIEKAYGEDVSQHLHNWCIKYFVDDQVSSSWYAWGTLFHYFYNLDEIALSEFISPVIQKRIRDATTLNQYGEIMVKVDEQLSLSRIAPLTEWETWLERKMQNAVGDNDVVNLIEFTLTDIKLVVSYHHVAKIWERLVDVILPNEQQILIEWAHWQAEEVGIPSSLVDLALSAYTK
jgi:hypothetical protein